MAFGTLFTLPGYVRDMGIRMVAKANGIELKLDYIDWFNRSAEHKKADYLTRIPAFLGEDGFPLSETVAIAIYLASQNEKTTLLGKTKQDYASILKWMSFANMDLTLSLNKWYLPLQGIYPYEKNAVDEAAKAAQRPLGALEEHLTHHTFLVGERITLADIFTASLVYPVYLHLFGIEERKRYPALTRWFDTISSQAVFSDICEKPKFLDVPALTNVPPKQSQLLTSTEKPKAEEKPKAAEKPAAKPAAQEEEPAEAPKAKHPIEALGRASYPIDDFKRFYSNNETPEAMEYFWKTVPWTEYSLWRCDYKYNDELTQTFMSGNLIGGFNHRLEASRKYFFGSCSVYGESNASIIRGAFLIRGQDFLPVFDVAPDYESYTFTKLDPNNAEDKEFLYQMWSWEKPIVVDGKEYPHAVGKVFK